MARRIADDDGSRGRDSTRRTFTRAVGFSAPATVTDTATGTESVTRTETTTGTESVTRTDSGPGHEVFVGGTGDGNAYSYTRSFADVDVRGEASVTIVRG